MNAYLFYNRFKTASKATNKLPVLASTAEAPFEPDAEAAEPVADAVPVPEPDVAAPEPVVVADAVAGVLLAVTAGPGPWVII